EIVVQFAGLIYQTPTAITKRTTPTLVATRMALVVALSRIPITKTMVLRAMMITAGKLNNAPFVVNGSEESHSGIRQWKSTSRKTLRYLVQSAARTPQLIAYSRTKSQPMIQAKSSPKVA